MGPLRGWLFQSWDRFGATKGSSVLYFEAAAFPSAGCVCGMRGALVALGWNPPCRGQLHCPPSRS